jgi:hypothetical protein
MILSAMQELAAGVFEGGVPGFLGVTRALDDERPQK